MRYPKRVEPELKQLEIDSLRAKLKQVEEQLAAALRAPPPVVDTDPDLLPVRKALAALRTRTAHHYAVARAEGTSPKVRRIANLRADECGMAIAAIKGKETPYGYSDD